MLAENHLSGEGAYPTAARQRKKENSERSSSLQFLAGMDASPLPAGMRPGTWMLNTLRGTGAIRLSSTLRITWYAFQIERGGTVIEFDESKKVSCRVSSILTCIRLFVAYNRLQASRHLTDTAIVSIRNSESKQFPASGLRRWKSQALDVAACGSARLPAPTNATNNGVCGPNRKSTNGE